MPDRVKKIYDKLLVDFYLKAEDTPLLLGEIVRKDQNGICALHNEIISKVPEEIKNSHIISSVGYTHRGDRYHFSKQGYKLLGVRYAQTYLKTLGIDIQVFDPNFYIFFIIWTI